VRSEFDQLRAGATRATNQAATRAGAFGGSRQGVLEGTRLAELDRSQAQTIGGLLSNQFNNALGQGMTFTEQQRRLAEQRLQEPLFRQQMAQQFLGGGVGPVSQDQTQIQEGNLLGDIAGAGLTVAGALTGGPAGAAAGASLAGGGGGQQFQGFTAPQFFEPANFNRFSRFGR
jgi:hypothetical protein